MQKLPLKPKVKKAVSKKSNKSVCSPVSEATEVFLSNVNSKQPDNFSIISQDLSVRAKTKSKFDESSVMQDIAVKSTQFDIQNKINDRLSKFDLMMSQQSTQQQVCNGRVMFEATNSIPQQQEFVYQQNKDILNLQNRALARNVEQLQTQVSNLQQDNRSQQLMSQNATFQQTYTDTSSIIKRFERLEDRIKDQDQTILALQNTLLSQQQNQTAKIVDLQKDMVSLSTQVIQQAKTQIQIKRHVIKRITKLKSTQQIMQNILRKCKLNETYARSMYNDQKPEFQIHQFDQIPNDFIKKQEDRFKTVLTKFQHVYQTMDSQFQAQNTQFDANLQQLGAQLQNKLEQSITQQQKLYQNNINLQNEYQTNLKQQISEFDSQINNLKQTIRENSQNQNLLQEALKTETQNTKKINVQLTANFQNFQLQTQKLAKDIQKQQEELNSNKIQYNDLNLQFDRMRQNTVDQTILQKYYRKQEDLEESVYRQTQTLQNVETQVAVFIDKIHQMSQGYFEVRQQMNSQQAEKEQLEQKISNNFKQNQEEIDQIRQIVTVQKVNELVDLRITSLGQSKANMDEVFTLRNKLSQHEEQIQFLNQQHNTLQQSLQEPEIEYRDIDMSKFKKIDKLSQNYSLMSSKVRSVKQENQLIQEMILKNQEVMSQIHRQVQAKLSSFEQRIQDRFKTKMADAIMLLDGAQELGQKVKETYDQIVQEKGLISAASVQVQYLDAKINQIEKDIQIYRQSKQENIEFIEEIYEQTGMWKQHIEKQNDTNKIFDQRLLDTYRLFQEQKQLIDHTNGYINQVYEEHTRLGQICSGYWSKYDKFVNQTNAIQEKAEWNSIEVKNELKKLNEATTKQKQINQLLNQKMDAVVELKE
ncbi:Hypothetical_protein [Hexamita inflata]|uniref:Hypothetical_protein n=1 Tax=Hexamita inflata TaxID=28002 RepID=A0AA86TTX4_9EUKA|nr:Hypothetical protein HINF_LOCUS16231 [Hexamita inflata]